MKPTFTGIKPQSDRPNTRAEWEIISLTEVWLKFMVQNSIDFGQVMTRADYIWFTDTHSLSIICGLRLLLM